jgi:hypothetical protein
MSSPKGQHDSQTDNGCGRQTLKIRLLQSGSKLHRSRLQLKGDFDYLLPAEPPSATVPLSEGQTIYYSLSTFPRYCTNDLQHIIANIWDRVNISHKFGLSTIMDMIRDIYAKGSMKKKIRKAQDISPELQSFPFI